MSLLNVSNLTAFYGASQALFGVTLTISQGEVLALMGRNGMGKSTTIKSICRMIAAQGEVSFDGQDLLALPSYKAARLGLGLVPEGRRCFSNLTVQENLVAAARSGHWTMDAIFSLFPRLGERRTQLAASLSGGEQQMLAIGRALMTNPRLLILDEATEGLAPLIRKEIWDVIGKLKQETGLSILVVDKSVSELKSVCDKAVILERGSTVWSGAIADLDAQTTAQYVGV